MHYYLKMNFTRNTYINSKVYCQFRPTFLSPNEGSFDKLLSTDSNFKNRRLLDKTSTVNSVHLQRNLQTCIESPSIHLMEQTSLLENLKKTLII